MSVRDVVVVGGGPAGSATALWLARAGYHVELLERNSWPRAKPCGDCISPGANALLRRLGVWDAVRAADGARLAGWRLCSPASEFTSLFSSAADHSEAHYALAIERRTLDSVLLGAARAAGVEIREQARVTALTRGADGMVTGVEGLLAGEPFRARARLTVGADGLRSRVARLLGAHGRAPRLKKLSFTAHVRGVPGIDSVGEMHIAPGSCLGIAPVQSGPDPLCNVTVVTSTARASARRGPHRMMRDLLCRFPHRDLSSLIRDDDVVLASGPFDWPVRCVAFDGAVLVGDAAGYYDPFTGQGIFQALAAAELLAEHAVVALRSRHPAQAPLTTYAARQRALTQPARRVQRGIEFICARPRLAEAMFDALRRVPDAASLLVSVTGDLRPARALLSPRLLTRLIAAASYHAIA